MTRPVRQNRSFTMNRVIQQVNRNRHEVRENDVVVGVGRVARRVPKQQNQPPPRDSKIRVRRHRMKSPGTPNRATVPATVHPRQVGDEIASVGETGVMEVRPDRPNDLP